MLPEFDRTKTIDSQQALVFNQPCQYDIILGKYFLHREGIDMNFYKGRVKWLGRQMSM